MFCRSCSGRRERTAALVGMVAAASSSLAGTSVPVARTPDSVSVRLDGFRSVGSFLHARGGDQINDYLFLDIGERGVVHAVSWDLSITRVDPNTRFSHAGLGLVNLNALPVLLRPYDAPSFLFGGPDAQHDDHNLPLWTTNVTGSFDLTDYWIQSHLTTADLSVHADPRGLIYFELFESYDDDTDYGTTHGGAALHTDALVSGIITFHVTRPVASPGGAAAIALGAGLGGFRRRR